jgi:hypothetical protein
MNGVPVDLERAESDRLADREPRKISIDRPRLEGVRFVDPRQPQPEYLLLAVALRSICSGSPARSCAGPNHSVTVSLKVHSMSVIVGIPLTQDPPSTGAHSLASAYSIHVLTVGAPGQDMDFWQLSRAISASPVVRAGASRRVVRTPSGVAPASRAAAISAANSGRDLPPKI